MPVIRRLGGPTSRGAIVLEKSSSFVIFSFVKTSTSKESQILRGETRKWFSLLFRSGQLEVRDGMGAHNVASFATFLGVVLKFILRKDA